MLENVPNGSKIFIDSNIFIYHFLNLSNLCTAFLVRAEKRDISACTSTVVLAEVLHRLTIAEAAEEFGIRPWQGNGSKSAKMLRVKLLRTIPLD